MVETNRKLFGLGRVSVVWPLTPTRIDPAPNGYEEKPEEYKYDSKQSFIQIMNIQTSLLLALVETNRKVFNLKNRWVMWSVSSARIDPALNGCFEKSEEYKHERCAKVLGSWPQSPLALSGWRTVKRGSAQWVFTMRLKNLVLL